MVDVTLGASLAVLLGLCFGSFVTMASHRIPAGQSLLGARSCCVTCGRALGPLDLVPVISWLAFGGRCRKCRTPISARYPVIEAVQAVLFLLIFLEVGAEPASLLFGTMAVALLTSSVIDFEHGYLPDEIQVILGLLGLCHVWLNGPALSDALLGALAAAGIGWGMRWLFAVATKQECMGLGDVKLMGVAGLWMGWEPLGSYFLFSGVFGLVTGIIWKRITGIPQFPFGPALSAALFLTVVYAGNKSVLFLS